MDYPTPKLYIYYSSKVELVPRKKQSDYDYSCDLAARYPTFIEEEEDESREQADSESDNATINDRSSVMHVVQVHRNFDSTDVFTSVYV